MSQGFETKSADRLQNVRSQRKSKEIEDIGCPKNYRASILTNSPSLTNETALHL